MQTNSIKVEYTSSMKVTSITIIVLCVFLLFFALFYYPVISDNFDFWHVGKIITVSMSGHIEPDYLNAGYYVFGVVLAELASLPYEALPTLPLQGVGVIIISIALLKKVASCRSYFTPLILAILVFVTKYGNKSYFLYYCHGMGFMLAITLCLALSHYLKPSSPEKRQVLSTLIILMVFGLNYISYKMTLFSIFIILNIQVVNWLYNFRRMGKYCFQFSLTKLALLSIVFTLAFNQIMYRGLIPRLQEVSDSSFSGLDKTILSFYNPSKATPFDKYYFTYEVGIRNALTVWMVLLLLSTLLTLLYLTYKFYRDEDLSDAEMITFGFIISSISIFVIYNLLGQFGVELLVYSGFICYVLLYNTKSSSEMHRYLIVASLFILLALNGYITMESYEYQLRGIRDNNNYEYITVPANWYVEKVPYDKKNTKEYLYSDVFTAGLIAAEVKKAGLDDNYYPRIFSEDQIALLLLHDGKRLKNSDDVFFINYRLTYFSADNWITFHSWSKYRGTLKENPLVNEIYSSSDIGCVVLHNKIF